MPGGPGRFGQGFPCPALLRVAPASRRLPRTGLSPPTAHHSRWFRLAALGTTAPLLPRARRNGPGLGSSPFARHYSGNHCCLLLLRVLRCFSSPGSPPDRSGWYAFRVPGCPIRTPADRRPFAPPRGFSQLVASFFASGSLGIPRAPLHTSPRSALGLRPRATGCSRLVALCAWARGLHPQRFTSILDSSCLHTPLRQRTPSLVENIGVEPMTPCLQSRCSSQLS